MLRAAFKEWAAVCRALAEGGQSVILRKGGIAEAGGAFRPAHERFLLYPTYFHEQQQAGLKPQLLPLVDAAEADRPPAGLVRFTHFAEVVAVHHFDRLEPLLTLDPHHGWRPDTVRRRFGYRSPGLFVLVVRVYRLPTPVGAVERPEYAGCKTWVELDQPVPTDGAVPVLGEDAVQHVLAAVRMRASSSSS